MQKISHHIERVESLIQGALAQIISREIDQKSCGMITVSSVKVSKDQSSAKVYVIGPDESKKEEIIKCLKVASKQLRHLLSQTVQLRKTPVLHFYYDDVQTQGIRISQLLEM